MPISDEAISLQLEVVRDAEDNLRTAKESLILAQKTAGSAINRIDETWDRLIIKANLTDEAKNEISATRAAAQRQLETIQNQYMNLVNGITTVKKKDIPQEKLRLEREIRRAQEDRLLNATAAKLVPPAQISDEKGLEISKTTIEGLGDLRELTYAITEVPRCEQALSTQTTKLTALIQQQKAEEEAEAEVDEAADEAAAVEVATEPVVKVHATSSLGASTHSHFSSSGNSKDQKTIPDENILSGEIESIIQHYINKYPVGNAPAKLQSALDQSIALKAAAKPFSQQVLQYIQISLEMQNSSKARPEQKSPTVQATDLNVSKCVTAINQLISLARYCRDDHNKYKQMRNADMGNNIVKCINGMKKKIAKWEKTRRISASSDKYIKAAETIILYMSYDLVSYDLAKYQGDEPLQPRPSIQAFNKAGEDLQEQRKRTAALGFITRKDDQATSSKEKEVERAAFFFAYKEEIIPRILAQDKAKPKVESANVLGMS